MLEKQKILYPEFEDNINSVIELIEQLDEKKLDKISAKGNPPMPLVLWKLKSYVHTSLHRAIDLSRESCRSWENGFPAVSLLLTRSVWESAAYLFDFTEIVIQFINEDNLEEINNLINKWKYGDREIDGLPSITNVITIIDHLNKIFPNFKKNFGHLSNFCHPNYSAIGTLYSFQDMEEFSFEIDRKFGNNKKVFANFIMSLLPSLKMLLASLDRFNKIYPELERINSLYTDNDNEAT